MHPEGLRLARYGWKILAVAALLCQPVWGQARETREIGAGEEELKSPTRPHYIINGDALPGPVAYTPAQVRHAYGFDLVQNQGAGQIIGIVDAYDDPHAEADLGVFDKQFNLPACTSSNGCFRKVYASGRAPAVDASWSMEMALDIEWAHAIAPQAKIVLVEAATNSFSDLLAGVDVAVRQGASVISMSWSAGEFGSEVYFDNHFVSNGVTFLAASGDHGAGAAYPAASPYVVGVGGTTLSLNAMGNYASETAWSGSGGGLSAYEYEPMCQAQFGMPDDAHGRRGVPDVAFDANPSTGFAVYDSVAIQGQAGWFEVGGTSAGTPQWAALIAIANSLRAAARKAHLSNTNAFLYALAKSNLSSEFRPVNQGTNGTCGALCSAMPGYDFVTGLGSPQANRLIAALAALR